VRVARDGAVGSGGGRDTSLWLGGGSAGSIVEDQMTGDRDQKRLATMAFRGQRSSVRTDHRQVVRIAQEVIQEAHGYRLVLRNIQEYTLYGADF
jgi:hypothetical protein